MVTTRITEAVPITMPSPVSRERTGLARNAWRLKRSDSPNSMSGLAARLAKQAQGFGSRRILGGELRAQISLQDFACLRLASGLDVEIGFGKHQLRAARRDSFGSRQALVGFLDAALPHQKARQLNQLADLLRSGFHGAPQVSFGGGILAAFLGKLGLREIPLGGAELRHLRRRALRLIHPAAQKAGRFDVVIEQIGQRIEVARVEFDGPLQILARFRCVAGCGEQAGALGAPPVCAASQSARTALPGSAASAFSRVSVARL